MKDAAEEAIQQAHVSAVQGVQPMKLSEFTAELEAEREAALDEQVRSECAALARIQAEHEEHLQQLAEENMAEDVAAAEMETVVELPEDPAIQVIKLPSVASQWSAIYFTVPLQLLSYYVALLKGTDVDQPRNLAKSVTVE